MVIDNNSVDDHEDGLWYAKRVLRDSRCLRLEVLYTIIRDISNSATCKGWDFWKLDIAVLGKFLLKWYGGIALDELVRPCLNDFERIWALVSNTL